MSSRRSVLWRPNAAFLAGFVLFLFYNQPLAAQTRSNEACEIRRIAFREGMINQSVTALCTDGTGALWIGTLHGLYTFDGFRLERFDVKNLPERQLSSPLITGLESDTFPRNIVFICTGDGMIALDPIERRIVSDTALGLPEGFLKSCLQIKNSHAGFFWVLSPKGIHKLVKTAVNRYSCQLQYPLEAGNATAFYSLIPDPVNTEALWILPPSQDAYYLSPGGLQHFSLPENKANQSPVSGLTHWLYTEQGIIGWDQARNMYRFNTGLKRIELVNEQYNLYQFLPNMKEVDHYMEQKSPLRCFSTLIGGQQVFGTNLGLFIVRKKTNRFQIIEPLRGEEIRGIHTDSSGKWWAGTYNGIYAGQVNQTGVTRHNILNVWDFLQLNEHQYLLAREVRRGFTLCDLNLNEQLPDSALIPPMYNSNGDFSGLSLCRDTAGTIWGGTYNYLLWAPAPLPLRFRFWTNPQTGQPLVTRFLRSLIADHHSGIWAGHEDGLLRIVYNKQAQRYEEDSSVPDLKGIAISDLFQDKQDRIWIATKGKGIACLDMRKPQNPLRWYNSEDGLCHDFTCRIESSNQGEVLWISTHNGLSRFTVKTGSFHNFFEDSGFPSNEFNSAASAQFPDGTLLFGGVSGLIRFHPDSIQSLDFHHKTILSVVRYFDKESGQLTSLYPAYPEGLRLPPYPEYLELQLGSTEFVEPEKVRFRYRMHGLSELWTYTNREGEVKFIRLAPGNYIFEVQVIPLDGSLGQAVFLPVFVATPFYETWWFKTLLIGIGIIVVYLAYRYRLRQLMREQLMRRQIADDLHDDIGNKLNIISIVAQKMVKNEPENVPQTTELNKLIELSRNALRSLHTMIWSVDAKKDRLSSLFDRMQDFADGYLRPLNIKFKFDLKESGTHRNINLKARHHIMMIYQELLTNMVKYTHPVLIRINIRMDRDALHIHLTNEHQISATEGFSAFSAHRGLSSIERRLNRINGKFTWTEPSEERQEVKLVVPRIFKR